MKFIINSKDIRKLFDERFGEVSVTNIKQTSLLIQENIFFSVLESQFSLSILKRLHVSFGQSEKVSHMI